MKRQLRRMGVHGDQVLAEWDTQTVDPKRLTEIETEFNDLTKKGYFAADITDGKNELIRKFDPQADIVMIPRMQGGCVSTR